MKEKKAENILVIIGFVFSFLGPLSIVGIILLIIGLVLCKEYKKPRKDLAILGIVIASFVLLFSIIGIVSSLDGETYTPAVETDSSTYESEKVEEEKEEKKKIEVIDFSQKSRTDSETWCNENKLSCSFSEEYSDSVQKGEVISQSVSAGEQVYEYKYIKIVYSLGNKPTISQQNALKKALSYLKYSAFSYSGLVEQLEYEKFSHEDAVYGVDNCGADWNEQAKKKAESYLKYDSFSRDGLIDQLEYEGFTYDQAVYGVTQNGL